MASTWILFILIPIAILALSRRGRPSRGEISERIDRAMSEVEGAIARHKEFQSWSSFVLPMRELRNLASEPILDVARIRQLRAEVESQRISKFDKTPLQTIIYNAKVLERIASKEAKTQSP